MEQEIEEVPQRTPFDNDITMLYKQADFQGRAVSDMVSILDKESGIVEHFPMSDYITVSLEDNDIVEVYKEIKSIDPSLKINRFIYNYLLNLDIKDPNLASTIVANVKSVYQEGDPTNVNVVNNQRDLIEFFQALSETAERETLKDSIRVGEIANIQQQLDVLTHQPAHFFVTKAKINWVILSFTPTWAVQGRKIDFTDGFNIFDNAVVSPYVPFIQYNDSNGQRYYKLYRGASIDTEPQYQNLIIPASRTKKSNAIYMTMWLGDSTEESPEKMYTAPKDSFHEVVFNLVDSYMTISIPVATKLVENDNKNISIQRISRSLPNIDLGESEEIRVRSNFKMLPFYNNIIAGSNKLSLDNVNIQFDIFEHVFMHMVLNDKLLFRHIYVEENNRPYPLKQRLDLRYRPAYSDIEEAITPTSEAYISNSASVSFNINVVKTTGDETIAVLDNSGNEVVVSMPPGYNYVSINISKAESREAVDEFVKVIKQLLTYYFWGLDGNMGNLAELDKLYRSIIPDNDVVYQVKEEIKAKALQKRRTKSNRKIGERVAELMKNHGDIFGGIYSRKCQSYHQPVTVKTLAEAEAWKNKTYTVSGKQYPRSYIPFPAPPAPTQFYVVCPDDRAPHPGVMPNNTGHNPKQYPFVPCCFPSIQNTSNTNTYAQYYRGVVPDNQDRKNVTIKKTKTMLDEGRIGYLPSDISEILTRQSQNKRIMIRYGSIRSKSSFLHATLAAIGHPDYTSSEDREAYVRQMRLHLARTTRPELLQQEIYDLGIEEITQRLYDPEVFLDPALFYRALEEAFKVNIYTFAVTNIKENMGGHIEVPRHMNFHSRPLRLDRPTVIIYKHVGSESNNLKYPQCELIIDQAGNPDLRQKMYGEDMTKICHKVLESALSTITWILPDMSAHSNVYNVIDFDHTIGHGAISQYVDSNGKARAFTLFYQGNPVTIVTPPTQPVNSPHDGNIRVTTPEIAISLLNQPSSIVRRGNRVIGLWFPAIGIENAIYVRVAGDHSIYNSLPEGPPDPITTVGDKTIDRITRLKRVLSFIMQLIKWLLNIYRKDLDVESESGNPNAAKLVYNFFQTYFTVDNTSPNEDSLTYYDFSNLPHHLPLVNQVNEGIDHIATYTRNFVRDGLINLYNHNFLISVYGEIKRYYQNSFGDTLVIAEELDNYYVDHNDFAKQANAEVFVGNRDLEHWVASRMAKSNPLHINNTISISSANNLQPFLYQHSDERIYLIQNPEDGTLNSAATIARTWYDNKVNVGPNPTPTSDEDLPTRLLYGISPSGELVAIKDLTNGNSAYISILGYGTETDRVTGNEFRYGAMLPVL